MLNLILFGPPGAGKGTQSVKVAEKYELIHLSTGDILRAEIKNGTELGQKAKSFIDKGELVPDAVVIGMIGNKLDSNSDANGFIFDGFPRTIPQAEALDQLLNDRNTSIELVVSLEVNNEELVVRLKNRALDSGRTDDADENIIRNRIKVYENETLPLKEFYQNQGKLKKVEGIGSVDQIFNNICSVVE
jgi:adenylate kinase